MWPFGRRKRSADTDPKRPLEDSDSVFDRMRDGLADAFASGDGNVSVTRVVTGPTRVDVNGEEYDPNNPLHAAIVQHLESATGRDLDGDGEVVTQPGAPGFVFVPRAKVTPPPPPSNDWPAPDSDGDDALERVEALERLAALHASGALTRSEFEAEKARLLEGG